MPPSSLHRRPFSLSVRIILLLLGLLLGAWIAVINHSAEMAWQRYKPWLGEPQELISHFSPGGSDFFRVKLTDEQYQDWVHTFQLEAQSGLTEPQLCMKSTKPIQLTGVTNEDTLYSIELSKNHVIIIDERALDKDSYMLKIDYADAFYSEQQERLTVAPKHEHTHPLAYDVMAIMSVIVFFLLSPLMARLLIKRREGYFPWRELAMNYVASFPIYIIFNFLAMLCIGIFSNSNIDSPFLMMIFSLVIMPVTNAVGCLSLYLLIGLYRRIRKDDARLGEESVESA